MHDVRRARVETPSPLLTDWQARLIDYPSIESSAELMHERFGALSEESTGILYVVPARGLTDSDAQTLDLLRCRQSSVAVIENLRAGQVRRFRASQIDALEDYLIECGCLDDRPILDGRQIREAITPLVFADCEADLLSRERVDQLVALVVLARSSSGNHGVDFVRVCFNTDIE